MALSSFGGGYGGDPFAMMDPLFFDSARPAACAAALTRLTRRASPLAVAGMGGGLDTGVGTTSGSRRRATMPADVLETQVSGPKAARGFSRGARRRAAAAVSGADARRAAARACSRLLARRFRARRPSSSS